RPQKTIPTTARVKVPKKTRGANSDERKIARYTTGIPTLSNNLPKMSPLMPSTAMASAKRSGIHSRVTESVFEKCKEISSKLNNPAETNPRPHIESQSDLVKRFAAASL